jgi:hypothetical protein
MALVYKMTDVYSLSSDFEDKFKPLCDLGVGEKLLILNGHTLAKDQNSAIVQSFSRWWSGFNRFDIVNFIEADVETYLSFLRFVNGTQKSKKTGLDERRQLENIYNKHINIVKSMINGLEKMKLTYRSSEEVVEQIDKIINSLNYVNV